MIPDINSTVEIFLRNGARIHGKVIQWSDNKSVLENNKNFTVIMKTSEDVFMYKIIFQNSKIIENKIEEIKKEPLNYEKIESLAELKKDLIVEERNEFKEKLLKDEKDLELEERKIYEYPRSIFKNAGTLKHTAEKSQRKDIGINQVLRNLFKQK